MVDLNSLATVVEVQAHHNVYLAAVAGLDPNTAHLVVPTDDGQHFLVLTRDQQPGSKQVSPGGWVSDAYGDWFTRTVDRSQVRLVGVHRTVRLLVLDAQTFFADKTSTPVRPWLSAEDPDHTVMFAVSVDDPDAKPQGWVGWLLRRKHEPARRTVAAGTAHQRVLQAAYDALCAIEAEGPIPARVDTHRAMWDAAASLADAEAVRDSAERLLVNVRGLSGVEHATARALDAVSGYGYAPLDSAAEVVADETSARRGGLESLRAANTARLD
jgi:hypothetical protein